MELLKDMERPNRPIEAVYFMEAGVASPSNPTRRV
jgi:hypothetical protein